MDTAPTIFGRCQRSIAAGRRHQAGSVPLAPLLPARACVMHRRSRHSIVPTPRRGSLRSQTAPFLRPVFTQLRATSTRGSRIEGSGRRRGW